MQADCFEGNREVWQKENGLDLAQSVTGPSAAYQALWKKTGATYTLISPSNGGQELLDELEAGMMGGVCVVFQPSATANNPMLLPPKCEIPGCADLHDQVRKNLRAPTQEIPFELLMKYYVWAATNGYDFTE